MRKANLEDKEFSLRIAMLVNINKISPGHLVRRFHAARGVPGITSQPGVPAHIGGRASPASPCLIQPPLIPTTNWFMVLTHSKNMLVSQLSQLHWGKEKLSIKPATSYFCWLSFIVNHMFNHSYNNGRKSWFPPSQLANYGS